MRRIRWILAASALLVSSCAATLRLQATAPTQDNAAPCGSAPVTGPAPAGTLLAVWFRWTGPETDSVSVTGLAPGARARVEKTVKPGTYTVTSWAVDQSGNRSCDTTATFTFKSNPAKVSGLGTYTP